MTTNKKLEKEVEIFERLVPMTTLERELVQKWVDAGYSPFTNPFGLVNLDGGSMLNIIQALKENPYVREAGTKTGGRYGMSDIICIEELVTDGWETAGEGICRARI